MMCLGKGGSNNGALNRGRQSVPATGQISFGTGPLSVFNKLNCMYAWSHDSCLSILKKAQT